MFNTIPPEWIEVGRALKKSLFQSIKDNFDDHESRINSLEASNSDSTSVLFHVYGNYALLNDFINVEKTVSLNDATISAVTLIVDKAGSTGTTEIDLLTDRSGTYESIFSTKPSIDAGADDEASTNSIIDPSKAELREGDIIRLDLVDAQVDGDGFFVKIDLVFT